MVTALTKARIRTTLILNGTELPSCFADSTISALCNVLDRNADKRTVRRLSGKVARITTVSP
jgi:hypothetical protein